MEKKISLCLAAMGLFFSAESASAFDPTPCISLLSYVNYNTDNTYDHQTHDAINLATLCESEYQSGQDSQNISIKGTYYGMTGDDSGNENSIRAFQHSKCTLGFGHIYWDNLHSRGVSIVSETATNAVKECFQAQIDAKGFELSKFSPGESGFTATVVYNGPAPITFSGAFVNPSEAATCQVIYGMDTDNKKPFTIEQGTSVTIICKQNTHSVPNGAGVAQVADAGQVSIASPAGDAIVIPLYAFAKPPILAERAQQLEAEIQAITAQLTTVKSSVDQLQSRTPHIVFSTITRRPGSWIPNLADDQQIDLNCNDGEVQVGNFYGHKGVLTYATNCKAIGVSW